MFKKLLLILCLTCFALPAAADKGINLFAYSRKVPETAIYSPYGQAFHLQDFKGNFLIVVFWSKTCIPCIRELDNLEAFVRKTRDNGIKIILVSPEKDWATEDEQKNFLRRYGAENVEFYVDRDARLSADFGIFTSPHAVLINQESMEIGRIRGAVAWDDEDVIEYIYKIKAQKQPGN